MSPARPNTHTQYAWHRQRVGAGQQQLPVFVVRRRCPHSRPSGHSCRGLLSHQHASSRCGGAPGSPTCDDERVAQAVQGRAVVFAHQGRRVMQLVHLHAQECGVACVRCVCVCAAGLCGASLEPATPAAQGRHACTHAPCQCVPASDTPGALRRWPARRERVGQQRTCTMASSMREQLRER